MLAENAAIFRKPTDLYSPTSEMKGFLLVVLLAAEVMAKQEIGTIGTSFPVFRAGTSFQCKQSITVQQAQRWFANLQVDTILQNYGLTMNDFIVINPKLVPVSRYSYLNSEHGPKTSFCVAGWWLSN